MNERLKTECDILRGKWDKTGMLKNMEGHATNVMAVLLENQRLFNEMSTDSGDSAQFKRISIPLVRRVFDPKCFVGYDMVSIQVLLGPAGIVTANRPDGDYSEEIAAKTRKLRAIYNFDAQQDIRSHNNLHREAEILADIAVNVSEEISREIITDLRTNCGLVRKSNLNVWRDLGEAMSEVWEKCGACPNWVVINPKIGPAIKQRGKFTLRRETYFPAYTLRRTGELELSDGKVFNIIEDAFFPEKEILFGHKGGDFTSGYVYAGYVPFGKTPVVLDPNSFIPRVNLLTRYAKKLVKGGSDFYGKVIIEEDDTGFFGKYVVPIE